MLSLVIQQPHYFWYSIKRLHTRTRTHTRTHTKHPTVRESTVMITYIINTWLLWWIITSFAYMCLCCVCVLVVFNLSFILGFVRPFTKILDDVFCWIILILLILLLIIPQATSSSSSSWIITWNILMRDCYFNLFHCHWRGYSRVLLRSWGRRSYLFTIPLQYTYSRTQSLEPRSIRPAERWNLFHLFHTAKS